MSALLNFAFNAIKSNVRHLDFPMKAILQVTNACNSRCQTCNIWKIKPENEWTYDELDRFFQKSNDFNWLDITGGEIFLRRDIEGIFETVLKRCENLYLLHFATNALCARTVEITERVLKQYNPRLLMVTVSLDGDRETHEEIRGIPKSWDKNLAVFKELRKLNGSNFKVVLGMTLSRRNADHYDRTFQAVKAEISDLQHDDMHINIAQSSDYYDNQADQFAADPELAWKSLEQHMSARDHHWWSPVDYLERRYQKLGGTFLNQRKSPLSCQSASVSCFITPHADVRACLMWDRTLGNLRDVDFDLRRIWNNSQTATTREDIARGDCPHCWTPCEAYQTIIANFFGLRNRDYRNDILRP